MGIKEIAQKIAPGYWKRDQWNIEYFDSVGFAEALISAYKAELLNEVGEPVLYAEFAEDGGWLGDASEYADHLEEPHALYTSDQLAAALLKATKPLEEEVERLKQQSANRLIGLCKCGEDNDELRAQLSAAQEEIERYKASPTVETCRQMIESQAVKENKILFDQLAKAEQLWQVAKGRCDGLEEKLAKAEQRVAEACALQVATETKFHWLDAARVAKEIRSGEWRKFVKEEV